VEALGIAFAVLFGLAFGSFANVVVHRVPLKQSIVKPASQCPSCGTPLAARDNIPVLSWLLLRGKCRYCGARISARYPSIELLTGVLWGLAAWRIHPTTNLIAYLPLLWVLVVLTFIDLEHLILPDRIVLPSVAAGIILLGVSAALGPGIQAWVRALIAGAGTFVLFLLMPKKAMGGGDVKLSPLLGMALAYFSWPRLFVGFFAAFLAGALGGVALIAAKRAGMKSEIPFGPYLAFGTVFGILFGGPIARAWVG